MSAPLFDAAAEQALLGAMLVNDDAATLAASVRRDDLYRERERRVLEAIVRTLGGGARPDVTTVGTQFGADPEMRAYVATLPDLCPTATNARAYLRTVQDVAAHRRLRTAYDEMGELAKTNGLPPDELCRRWTELLAGATPAGTTGHGPRSTIVCAADLDAADVGAVDWIVNGFVAAGNLTGITAAPKVGKTTLALLMARALTTGQPFLDHETVKTGVVYLTEQSPSSFANQLARAGLLGCPDLHIMYRSATRKWDWPTIVAGAVAHALDVGARVLIPDTLSDFTVLPIEGWENDSGLALQALQPLRDATANHGLGVVVLRHARKGAGDPVEEARGSSAYPGGLDIVLSLRKLGGVGKARQRVLLDAGSRPEGVPEQLVVEYTEGDPGQYRVLGDALAVAQHEARADILTELTDDFEQAVTMKQVYAMCPDVKQTSVQIALGRLIDDGLVLRGKGAGSASSRSYGYWRPRELP
jgi:hypothetical protein